MLVLILCEESQTVCKAFRKMGHEAYSVDLQDCSGGFPEWHFVGDAIETLNWFIFHSKPDLVIAHPPCTYLSSAGNRHFNISKYGDAALDRIVKREFAVEFVQEIWQICIDNDIPCCIENPRGYLNTHWHKPSQVIQPYFFSDPFQKLTCLWLHKLPCLYPSDKLSKPCSTKYANWFNSGSVSLRQKRRSVTFPGIAEAMAFQWSNCFFV